MKKLCECGCGKETKEYRGKYNRFIVGHNTKGKVSPKKGKKSGYPAWNKGLTKDSDKRVRKYGKSQRLTKKGLFKRGKLAPWNKGLDKNKDERIKKSSEKYPKNRKKPRLSKEQRDAKIRSFTGENNPNFNFNKTKFEKYKIKCKFDFDLGRFPEEFKVSELRNMFHPTKNKKGYTRDHVLSIYDGFKIGINPLIIKHPANCKLMLHAENSRKNKKSKIKEKKLLKKIKLWDEKYGRYN